MSLTGHNEMSVAIPIGLFKEVEKRFSKHDYSSPMEYILDAIRNQNDRLDAIETLQKKHGGETTE